MNVVGAILNNTNHVTKNPLIKCCKSYIPIYIYLLSVARSVFTPTYINCLGQCSSTVSSTRCGNAETMYVMNEPVPVAARSMAWFYRRSLAGVVGSNPSERAWISVCREFCQVDFSATGWSLVQSSPTDFGVSECDREALIMSRIWPTRDCRAL